MKHCFTLGVLVVFAACRAPQAPDARIRPAEIDFGDAEHAYTGSSCTQQTRSRPVTVVATVSSRIGGSLQTSPSTHFNVGTTTATWTNERRQVNILFSPQGLGPFEATLTMSWVHAQGRSNTITLKGRGVCPGVDADGDGIIDRFEDPNNNGVVDAGETDKNKRDTDGDGIEDGIEDADRDGIRDGGEMDPTKKDSDGDGLDDNVEDANGNGRVDRGETDPKKKDTDGDGLDDNVEDANGNGRVDPGETDPRNDDTDDDGKKDGEDPFPLDPLR